MEPKAEPYDTSHFPHDASTAGSSSSLSPLPPTDDGLASPALSSPLSAPAKSPGGSCERQQSSTPSAGPDSPEATHRRPSTANSSKSGSDREKRKRSRVNPEQLVHLERFFAMDRSPTAARRKEISELLGMQERQTQIWFQNRRAKAKLMDGKGKLKTDTTPPQTPPELRPGYEASLQNLIHEGEAITIIPCYELTVGTWRRIASQLSKHDLVTYVCESRRCLVWFIHSSGYGFKMEIPFDIILDTEFTHTSPGQGLASFTLSQPPHFYLEEIIPSDGARPPQRSWKVSADWTEHSQASKVLRHDLIGSAVQLGHILRTFQLSSSSEVRLQPPSYGMRTDTAPPVALEPLTLPRIGESQTYSQLYASHRSQELRQPSRTSLDIHRRPSFPNLSLHNPAAAQHDYLDVDPPPHRRASTGHVSPASSTYPSYSQMTSPASTTSTSPYSTAPPSMYSPGGPGGHTPIDDVAHVPLSSRGYAPQTHGYLSQGAAPSYSSHSHPHAQPHVHGHQYPSSHSPAPNIGDQSYGRQDMPRLLQPSGMVGSPVLSGTAIHYDRDHNGNVESAYGRHEPRY